MDYIEARKYLKEISKYGSVLGLETIKELLLLIDNPHNKLRVIHVAGTNGKGSVLTYIESILIEAGYNVGRFSSPAVFKYREIIKYNDKDIEPEELAKCVTIVKEACDKMVKHKKPHPTVFEVETAASFLYFLNKQCDIVLIETGMGGETDATNVMEKVICSVITSISMDHMQFLGNTIAKIANVKCGIIKDCCQVVTSAQLDEAMNIITEQARKHNSNLIVAKQANEIIIENYKTYFKYKAHNNVIYDLNTKMVGAFQPDNAATAVETAIVIRNNGYNINDEQIISGIEKAFWPGRMEVIKTNPLIVIDGAHNPGAAKMLEKTVQMYFTNKRIAFIMGVLADKDYDNEIEIVAKSAEIIYTITPNNERALDGEKLAQTVGKYNKKVEFMNSLKIAVESAVNLCNKEKFDMVLAFGSLSFLGELKDIVNNANS